MPSMVSLVLDFNESNVTIFFKLPLDSWVTQGCIVTINSRRI